MEFLIQLGRTVHGEPLTDTHHRDEVVHGRPPISSRRSAWSRPDSRPSKTSIDKAVVAGLSHPMGPLRLSGLVGLDTLRLSGLVGLDTLKLIADKMFEEFKEPHYGPPPLLLRMVEAGLLGKKSGRGFYSY
jgi:hypothetical protein